MKLRFVLLLGGVLAALVSPAARAQFYSPDTEFHDRTQRHFPVELARVLAWRQNAANAANPAHSAIAEVTYEVGISGAGKTMWKIHWLDAAGKSIRDFEVDYDEAALTSGPEFYRSVSRSMMARKKGSMKAEDLSAGFWQGADSAGPSRAESLQAAFAIDPHTAANAPRAGRAALRGGFAEREHRGVARLRSPRAGRGVALRGRSGFGHPGARR